MILGTGIDIIEVERVQGAIERHGDRFLDRVFLPAEVEYCRQHTRPGPHWAARFAAKEAVAKALGTGIGGELGWRDIEIVRRDSGEPVVKLHGKGAELLARRGGTSLVVSLSHTQGYAAAVAILEGEG